MGSFTYACLYPDGYPSRPLQMVIVKSIDKSAQVIVASEVNKYMLNELI